MIAIFLGFTEFYGGNFHVYQTLRGLLLFTNVKRFYFFFTAKRERFQSILHFARIRAIFVVISNFSCANRIN